MKKTAFVTILSATLLLTSCSSGQTPATSAATETTTIAATTEATTKETTAEKTTTTAKPEAEAKTEDYAELEFNYVNETQDVCATDFEFVNAELYKDANGVLLHPNYPSGKNIVVRFKSEKQFKFGSIKQFPSAKLHDDTYMEHVIRYYDGKIAKIEMREIYKPGKPGKSNISKYLSYKDGFYTLTIPSKYAKTNNGFYIFLSTNCVMDEDGNIDFGNHLTFYVRCDKEPITPMPSFKPEQHGVGENFSSATDFIFVNAELPISHNKYRYIPENPIFQQGKDIVITFKCKEKISLNEISMGATGSLAESVNNIADPDYLKNSAGTYTLTIPAQYAQPGSAFNVTLSGKNDDSIDLYFSVAS